jgi:hypothetical protein
MNRFLATCWRVLLILLVYLLLAVPLVGLVLPGANGHDVQVPMLFQSLLRGAAYSQGFFPDNVYYEDWQAFVSAYAMNCLLLSMALAALWNVVYAPRLLGRNHERSARITIWAFVAAHAGLMLLYAFETFSQSDYVWNWLILQPAGLWGLLLLPQVLAVPFYLVLRALCPARIYHIFPIFAKIRAPLHLRVYSKRGAR